MGRLGKIALVCLVVFITAVFLFLKFALEPMVNAQVQSYLDGVDSEFYTYNYKTLKLNILDGSIRIKEVDAIPGDAAFDSLKSGVYEDIDRIHASDVYISINYISYLRKRQVEIDEIRIIDPKIDVYYQPGGEEKEQDPVALDGLLTGDFQGLYLDHLRLENAAITFNNIKKASPDITLEKLDVVIDEVTIDNRSIEATPLGFHFRKIRVDAGALSVAVNEYYSLSVAKMGFQAEMAPEDTIPPGTNISISDIHYVPTESGIEELRNGGLRNLTEIQIENLNFDHFKISELVQYKTLTINELHIERPAIRSYVNTRMKKESRTNPSAFTVSKLIESITLDAFSISDGQVVITDIHKSASDLNLRDVNVDFSNVLINEETIDLPLGFQYSDGHFDSGIATSDLGEYYRLEIGPMHFDFNRSSLTVNDIQMIPKHSREEFAQATPYEQDQFQLSVGKIQANHLDMNALTSDLDLRLKSLIVDEAVFNVYRNKWIDDPEFVYKPLPSQAIRNVALPFLIDSVLVRGSTVTYEQLGDIVEYEDELPGKIELTELRASAQQVTNMPTLLQTQPELELNAQAMFMNSRMLTAQYRFVIPDEVDRFYVSAHMDSFPTSDLNPMVRNLLLVEIPDGFIYDLKVDMTGNDTLMTGQIQMEYDNLNINVLKTKQPAKSSGFLNTVANGILIKQNRRTRGKFITGIVNTERLRNKSVFNFTWQGIKSGLISTVVPFTKKEKNKVSKNRTDTK